MSGGSFKRSDVDEKASIARSSFSQEWGEPHHEWFWQRIPKRYVVAFMAFLGFCNIYALRVNLSVAIVAMTTKNRTVMVDGVQKTGPEFNWDTRTQGLILSAFFWGYIFTQLPGGWMARKVGGKNVFGTGVLGTAILTLVTPPIARINSHALIGVRIFEGLFEGVTYPCMHAIWSKWAPPLERSKLATIAFSGSYVGTVISLPLSSLIAQNMEWPYVFYIFGLLAIGWFILWCLMVTESPSRYRTISQGELEYIQQSIGFTEAQTKGQHTPWREIFLSPAVYAITAAHFAENWGFYTLLTELPSYMRQVLHFDLYRAGFTAALPYLVMAVVVQGGGQLADWIRSRGYLSTVATRKIFNCGAFIMQAAFMIGTAYATSAATAVACLTFAVGFGGFAWSGFSVNHLDIAPQFACVLMGISNTFATVPGIVSPAVAGALVTHKTAEEWRKVFFIAAGVYAAGALLYGIFARGEQASWAEVPRGYAAHCDVEEEQQE